MLVDEVDTDGRRVVVVDNVLLVLVDDAVERDDELEVDVRVLVVVAVEAVEDVLVAVVAGVAGVEVMGARGVAVLFSHRLIRAWNCSVKLNSCSKSGDTIMRSVLFCANVRMVC